MLNVLLITPLNIPFKDIKPTSNIRRKMAPKYPVGLMCIGAYVKKHIRDVDIRIVDYNTEVSRYTAGPRSIYTLENMLSYGLTLVPFAPDIIGISVMLDGNYADLKPMISYLRFRYPSAYIVIGGHLASSCYKQFLDEIIELDAVCYGEGEYPFMELAHSYKKNIMQDYVKTDPSWITREKLKDRTFKPWNMMIQNLDEIPPYDLDMLMWPADYFNTNDDLFALGTERHEKDIYMFATRGCPYHCIFCASQFVHGHKVRKYSAKRIKADILHYNEMYGITSFPFLDDHFLANKYMALDILKFIEKHGFTCRIFNLNYLHVDQEIIRVLKRTGSDRILITLDGLDEKFLRKVVRKPANFAKAKEVIQICREEKIDVIANIIVGYPGEVSLDMDLEARRMRNMGANWYSVLTAAPLHGSELYNKAKEAGYLPPGDEFLYTDYYTPVITTPEFTPEWIKWRAYEINLDLNFVYNYDMRFGEWRTALRMFERVMGVEPNHAFAYYYASICAQKLGMIDNACMYRNGYYRCKRDYPEWAEWARYFNLKEIEDES